jgi:hypothetical protein
MDIVQLSAVTLVPVSVDRTPLTAELLRDLILGLRSEADRVEHVKVIERAGIMWIGAYVSVVDKQQALVRLHDLCGRLTRVINGWDIVRDPDTDLR